LDTSEQRGSFGWIVPIILGVAVVPSGLFAAETSDAQLRVAAVELANVPSLSFETMVVQLDALLAGSGVRLLWRRSGPGEETARDELRVVFLGAPGRGAHAGHPILAASGPTGPAPTVWVYMPTVRAALGLPRATRFESFLAQRAMGVALGRVLAHELVHLLAPQVPHGTGVMAPRFRLTELGRGAMALDGTCARALLVAARAWEERGGPPLEADRRAQTHRPGLAGGLGATR
jgi:hypothetical protein